MTDPLLARIGDLERQNDQPKAELRRVDGLKRQNDQLRVELEQSRSASTLGLRRLREQVARTDAELLRRDGELARARRDLAEHDQLARVRDLAGLRKKSRRRAPRQIWPRMIEAEYGRAMIDLSIGVVRTALSALLKELPDLASRAKIRLDAEDLRRVIFCGFPVVIESPAGTIRRWRDSDGTDGETLMIHSYGYLADSLGADGEEVDVYLGPQESADWVYVIHQRDKSSSFKDYDEDKAMMGFRSADAARTAYLAQYDDPRFFGGMSQMTLEEFRSRLRPRTGRRITHDAGEVDRAAQLFGSARDRLARDDERIESTARRFADRTSTYNREQLGRQLRAVIGSEPPYRDRGVQDRISRFVAENAAHIRTLRSAAFGEAEKVVMGGLADGVPHDEMVARLAARFKVTQNHALSTARNQLGTLYSRVNHLRQKALGVRRCIWRSRGDDKVRDRHSDLEIETEENPYPIDEPPDGVRPGEEYGCRCIEEPVLEDLLAPVQEPDDEEEESGDD